MAIQLAHKHAFAGSCNATCHCLASLQNVLVDGQNDSLVFTFGTLCKLLLAAYISIIDVILTRVAEAINRPHWAPRRLLGVWPLGVHTVSLPYHYKAHTCQNLHGRKQQLFQQQLHSLQSWCFNLCKWALSALIDHAVMCLHKLQSQHKHEPATSRHMVDVLEAAPLSEWCTAAVGGQLACAED